MKLMQRPLLPSLTMYIVGLVAADAGSLAVWSALGVFVAAMLLLAPSRGTSILLLAIGGLGAMVGSIQKAERQHAEELVARLALGRTWKYTATVSSVDGYPADYALLENVSLSDGEVAYRMPGRYRMSLAQIAPNTREQFAADLESGDLISGKGRLTRLTHFYNFDALDPARQSLRQGVFGGISPESITRTAPAEAGISLARLSAGIRRALLSPFQTTLPARDAERVSAFFLNDYSGLSREELRNLQTSGLLHLYAVSGGHLGIVTLFIIAVLKSFRVSRRFGWLTSWVVLGLYCAAMGFPAAATRSWLMIGACTLAWWSGREVDGLSCLALAAAIALLARPSWVRDPGFLLSVAGTFGMMMLVPVLWQDGVDDSSNALRQCTNWIGRAIAGTVGASIAVMPLQLYYFQQFHLLAPVANIFGGAAASVALMAGGISILLYPISEWLSSGASETASLSLKALNEIARLSSSCTSLSWTPARPHLAAVWMAYAVLISGYYLTFVDTPEFRKKSIARLSVHATLMLTLLVASCIWTGRAPGTMVFRFLDVGQGDSTLVQFPQGATLLIDGGNVTPDCGRAVVVPELRALGRTPLTAMAVTHVDADHIGGLVSTQSNVGSLELWEGTNQTTAPLRMRLLDAANLRKASVKTVTAGDTFQIDGCTVRVLNPLPTTFPGTPDNDQSLVFEFEYGQFRAMLMGDAGAAVEGRLAAGCSPLTLLKVGHHGSKTATSPAFLRVTKPKYAVISCGRANRFGHPHRDVIGNLQEAKAEILRTDEQGAIEVTTDGYNITLRTATEH